MSAIAVAHRPDDKGIESKKNATRLCLAQKQIEMKAKKKPSKASRKTAPRKASRLDRRIRQIHRLHCRRRLFEHWQAWLANFSRADRGNYGTPTLDWRGCIGVHRIGRDYVCFGIAYQAIGPGGDWQERDASYFFTAKEAWQVFQRYHQLKEDFARGGQSTQADAAHLQPETWTGGRVLDWRLDSESCEITLFIASLIAFWDACTLKPPSPFVQRERILRDKWDGFAWRDETLPKLVRLAGLPPGLSRRVEKYALRRRAED